MSKAMHGLSAKQLDRKSFVPLYYQLQEVLKEQIESGYWHPDELLPSEPEFARRFGVSRAVVRQALDILEDDHQIVRIRGRGTFVARPKLDYRAGGLARLLATRRESDVTSHILDKRIALGERRIRNSLELRDNDELLRLATMLSANGVPLAISYSFFRRADVLWLDEAAQVGRNLPPEFVLGDYGIALAHSTISIEASQCGQFEADRFQIPHRSAVFLVLCTEYRQTDDGPAPFEVARVEYRGDMVQFQLDVSPEVGGGLSATWVLTELAEAVAPV